MKPFAQAKYKNERNTLKRAVKNSVADRIELEIGDSKSDEFYPQAKTMMWDNEVNFSIRRDNGARSFTRSGGKIIAPAKKENVVIYELEQDDINENGGLEIEVFLKEKPNTNVFEFTLQTKGLDFFYQPEPTEKEKKEGVYRPDNVIGSYAVYHKTKKNNIVGGKEYKTGKAFHIYRPKAIDANGNWVWCELNIDEKKNILTVTVPEEWLWGATYPVVIDPTFGYSSIGGTQYVIADIFNGNTPIPAGFNLTEAGNVSKITAYAFKNTFYGNGNDSAFIYDDNANYPKNLKGETPVSYHLTTSAGWRDFAFSSDVSLTAGKYWLGISSNAPYAYNYGDSTGGEAIQMHPNYGTTFSAGNAPAVFPSGHNPTTYRMSIYATYTPAPSSSPSVQARRGILLSM